MAKKINQHVDTDYSLEKVPESARKGFWPMFFIMLGFTFFSASMSVGAKLGNGLDLVDFIWALLIGGVILSIYTGVLAYIGSDTGLSLDLLAQRSFGKYGSYIPSALISFTQLGWFGVGVAMFAIPASELLSINPVILVVIAGMCMTASAYFGIKGLEVISYIAVPLIAVLGIYSMFTATVTGGGLSAVFSKGTGTISIFTGAGMVIGSFISGGTATPNFIRFAKSNKTAVITTVIAFFLGNTLMFAFGAVGGAFTGKDDIFYVLIAQGLAIPALLVLGANIWTTNDNALYTSGLGLSNITKFKKRPMVLIAGIIGTVAAIWLYNNFVGWLSFLNATLPPIGAIIALDFYMHRESYSEESTVERKFNIGAIAGVVAGAMAGNFIPFGIAAINAMMVSGVCFLLSELILQKRLKKITIEG
ncbi:cytosine permease [Sedimentibacter hydroxybenzoicus DSM 7310]|uniref:Cytosine permease n=1 Tax=Sedimentibacter hydroxybenzoicus DSM 7310 TaxID=1123245 RepID=A0A974GWW0_SEDHY|nr:cytosine permease [Sedimentibacter hydroxybenzoicus]NYB74873.1 cytosine permease [Sedimentibacter hydroxybenzoicus DSM 7310]